MWMWAALNGLCIAFPGSEHQRWLLSASFSKTSEPRMFSEYKGFSQVEPRSLSLKTKLHEYQARAARFLFGQDLILGRQQNLFRNNIFIYIWLFLSTFQTVWRFSVPGFCLRIPLPSWPRASWNLGYLVSNALQVCWDMEGPISASDILPYVWVAGLFLGWSKVVASVSLVNRQLATLLTWLLWFLIT